MIDYRDPRPIFEQIAENYKMQILRGFVLPDEQMPSVRTLAAELATNPNTVQKAYTALEREGYLYTVKGRGAFACGEAQLKEMREKHLDALAARLRDTVAEAEALGFTKEELEKRI